MVTTSANIRLPANLSGLARQLIGYQPRIGFEEGLRRTALDSTA